MIRGIVFFDSQQCDLSVRWDLVITSAILFNSYTGCPYGHVCCTNSAYWCTKSTVVKLQNTSPTLSAQSLQRKHDPTCDLGILQTTVYLGFGLNSSVIWTVLERKSASLPCVMHFSSCESISLCLAKLCRLALFSMSCTDYDQASCCVDDGRCERRNVGMEGRCGRTV